MIYKNTPVKLLLSAFTLFIVSIFIFCSKHSDNSIGPDIYKSTVTGTIIDRSGNGLNGVLVTSEPLGYTAVSNSSGNFTLSGLPAKNYRLSFHLLDYIDTVSDSVSLGIADTQALTSSIHMKYRYGTIVGCVTDKSGAGLIAAGVAIETQPVCGVSNTGGRYMLCKVEPGQTRIVSSVSGKGYGYKSIIVTADDTLKNADIMLDHDGGVVTGVIVNSQGQPVAGATVTGLGGSVSAITNSNGEFTITDVPSSSQVLLTVKSGADSMQLNVSNVLEGGSVTVDTVKIRPASVVANNMVLLSSDVRALSTDPFITLMVSAVTTGSARIASYKWDVDNNGTYDSTSLGPQLVLKTPAAGTYSVKVQAVDTSGAVSNPATINIIISAPLQAPTTPAGLMVLNSTVSTISLNWNNTANAQGYIVYRQNASNWDAIKLVPDTLYVDTGLLSNTNYSYRIASFNTTGFSAQSAIVLAKTLANTVAVPSSPTLLSPTNSIANALLTPTLSWNTVVNASTYRVQVSTVSTFSTIIADDSVLTVGTKAITGLANSTTYYWRVNARNAGGASTWSATWNFTTVPAIPIAPSLSSPSNAAINISTTPTLTWGTVSGAANYRVQLSNDNSFSSLIFDDSTLTSGSKAIVAALSGSATYYWRVCAKNAGGAGSWSSTWSFTTVPGAPGTPVLSSPGNVTANVSLTPTLNWGIVSGSSTYRVQLSTVSSFVNVVLDDSTLSGVNKTLSTALITNTTYYWRVNAKNAGGTGAWSATWNFTTVPSVPIAPSLSSPTNAVINVSTTPTLTWGTVSGAANYRVQLANDNSFASLIFDDSTLTSGSKTIVAALSGSATYYWRVSAKNAGGTSTWSPVWSFTVVPGAPSAPVLSSPGNVAGNVSLTPTLTWGTISGASTYRVQLSTASSFAVLVLDDSTVTGGTKPVSTSLSNSTTYYWRVNAKNAGGTGSWSSPWSFSTVPVPPGAPVQSSPGNTTINVSLTPTLNWGTVSGAIAYRVQMSNDNSFASLIFDDSTLTSGSKAIVAALSGNSTYYWRVSGKNAGGTSSWSSTWSFTTVPGAPGTPVLSSPGNVAANVSLTPTLNWGIVSGAATYRVQLSTISSFTTLVLEDSTLSGVSKVVSTSLSTNGTYYWRVNATNAGGTGAWSAIWSFTTLPAIPAAPVLTAPTNTATNQVLAPTLTFGTISNATSYRLQVSTSSTFGAMVTDDSLLSVGTKALTGLVNSTTYYWRTNAKNAGGTSAWSAIWSFTTLPAIPTAPTLATPSNAATGIAIAPTLTWGTVAGAVSYRVQLSTISSFGTTVVDDSTLNIGLKAITNLANSTTYYWRVNAKNAGGISTWSATWYFSTVAPSPPVAPSLSSPANAAISISTPPTLTWNTVSNANYYRVQLSTNSTFSTLIIDETNLAANSLIVPVLLSDLKTYYWRVNAKNTGGTGVWSAPWSFTTAEPPTVTDADGNVYHTILIGTQRWMVENLKTTVYNDGTAIPIVQDAAAWPNLTTPGMSWYNNDAATYMNSNYGGLYNWYAATSSKLAPVGWHVPSDADWTTLEDYLIANGYNYDSTTTGNKIAKSLASQTGWFLDSTLGSFVPGNYFSLNNRSGFSGLPGGFRDASGGYQYIGRNSWWWSTTEWNAGQGVYRGISWWATYSDRPNGGTYKYIGCSIRLVKDN